MQEVKRLEIVIDAAHTPEVVRAIKASQATGFTLIRDVQGSGERGDRSGDELANVYRNCYLIVACSQETALQLVETVRPLIQAHGGMCLLSDATWIKH